VKPFERQNMLLRLADLLDQHFEELAQLDTLDMGAPISRTRGARLRVIGMLRYYAGMATSLHGEVIDNSIPGEIVTFTRKEAVGVVGAIIPWNAPSAASIWKIAPALATGNTVVQKPAGQTPFSALWVAERFHEVGLPPGALNVLVGSVADVADTIVADPRVRMVTITGSVQAGEQVTRRAGIKKLALELGSSAANVVCADADLDAAARTLATSAYLSSGQACISAQRLFVHESVVDDFVARFGAYAEAMVIGDPKDPATEIGPMISTGQVERILGWIADAEASGVRVLFGGAAVDRTIRPTLVADVPPDTELACNEVFATVAVLSTFRTNEEVIEMANDSVFGLQAGVFTRDLATAHQLGHEIDAGAVWVNDSSRYRQDNYPFGGMKSSGIGREGVLYAMEEMTEWKFLGFKLGPSAGIL